MLIWQYWPARTGGSEAQCRRLSRCLAEAGVSCTVLTARPDWRAPSRERDGGVNIRRVSVLQNLLTGFRRAKPDEATSAGGGVPRQRKGRGGANGWVRRLNVLSFMIGSAFWLWQHRKELDVIHVHIGEWIAGFAGWMGRRLGIPVVCKIACTPVLPPVEGDIPFRRMLEHERKSIGYVALHSGIAHELSNEGIDEERIDQIPNGVVIPSRQSVPSQGKYVLCVGNLTQGAEHKGFDVLFRAWAVVAREFPNATLKVVGGGDSRVWREYVKDKGCDDSVEFPGYIREPGSVYENAALFVLASRFEGMSNALLESQSYGLPAVVSDIPGSRAVVSDGETGSIVPVGDADALAKEICNYLRDPAMRDLRGSAARARALSCFDIRVISDRYLDLYKKCIRSI